ncbi:caspase family protein [Streptomyces rimosus]|uniref:caspase family protein n=1 Tax=Streptomyces rimosus TaxID=1927 RepID=UPI000517E15A|nr:caspase family protein [Streptomyces rimosus]
MGRRFFVGLGSGRYCHLAEEDQLPGVAADIAAMEELLQEFGYRRVLVGLGEYDGAEQIRRKLSHWSRDCELKADDVVVLYFAGHGVVEDRGRHYLLCWDSREDDLAATALATEDVVRILCHGRLRQLLVVLDTCAGGAGAADGAGVVLHTLAHQQSGGDTSTGLWFLASARRKDVAEDGRFVTALRAAVDTTTERTGQRQQYLDLTELLKAVNERFEADGQGQRAELAGGMVTGLAPFLPNRGFCEDLPPVGTDLEIQRRVASWDLTEHFGPRSRGVEFESEQGLYFSGRVRVLSELVQWLSGVDGDGHGRVVTGSPGCGKSAVLGRVVALSDSVYRDRLELSGIALATMVPEGCVTAAVHARHKRLEEVVERIAQALGTEPGGTAALLQELTRRGRQGAPVVIVVDAVDEAGSDTAADAGGHGEPRRISRELLRPMSEIPGVRLLVGTRHELVTSLGPTFTALDLDDSAYRADECDVTGYVTRVLLAAEEPGVPTPYRERQELARTVAREVASRAAGVYLYARTTARTLRSDSVPVDVSKPGWADELPSEIGEAFDDYLARFGPDEPRVRRMLLSLAFSEGKGLPRGRIWTTLTSVISGVTCTEEDIAWVLDVAEAYIAEVTDDDRRSAYRLYHKALAEHLRRTADRPPEEIQRAVVDALTATVPRSPDEASLDWFAAPPYVRQHLATHAEAAGRLISLIKDPGFLLASESLALLRALASVTVDEASDGPRRIRSSYEQIAHRLVPDRALSHRAADLQLSARRCGADGLADRIDGLGVSLPWSARWAWWSASGTHRLLNGHTSWIDCVAVGALDERPIAVTGGRSTDRTARVWDLTTQQQIGEPLAVGIGVSAVAIGDIGDYTVALTGGVDGTVQVWDLSAGQKYGDGLTGHTNTVRHIAVGDIDGLPVALTASADGTARLWDLTTRRQLGRNLTAHKRTVHSAALGEIDGRPVALTGGADKRAYVWDLTGLLNGAEPEPDGAWLAGHTDGITAVAMGRRDGRAVALIGDDSGMISLWDLAKRRQIGEPVAAHVDFVRGGVTSVAAGTLNGCPVALTSGKDEAKLWNLRSLRQLAHPLRGHVGQITASALADRPDGPMAVTVGTDRTARIWDLTADQPAGSHTRQVIALAFAEQCDRPLVMTGSEDGTARVWDLRTRDQVGRPMEGHAGTVDAVALGPLNGRMLAVTGGSDSTIRLWDGLRGVPLGSPLEGHTNSVSCLALATLAGRTVLVSGSGDGTLRVWDVVTHRSLSRPISGHIGSVAHLAVRECGRGIEIAVATSLDHAYVWGVTGNGGELTSTLRLHLSVEDWKRTARIIGVAFLEARPVVISTHEGNTVQLLDIGSGIPVGKPFAGHVSTVWSAVLVRIGARDVVTTMSHDDTVRIWEPESGRALGAPLAGHVTLGSHRRPAGLVFGRVGGRPVGIIAFWREVRVWDLTTMQPVDEPLCGGEVALDAVSIVRTSRGHTVVTGAGDGTVRVHALEDGRATAPHITSGRIVASMATTGVAGECLMVRCGYTAMQIWDVSKRELLWEQPGRWDLARIHPLADRTLLVAAADDRSIQVWDLKTKAPVFAPMSGHNARVMDMRTATLSGHELAASASADGTVRLWDLRTGKPFGRPVDDHPSGACAVDFGRVDGRDVVLTGAGDGEVRMWELATGHRLPLGVDRSPAELSTVRLSTFHERPTVIVADNYGLVRVWDLDTSICFAEADLGDRVNDLAMTDNGQVCFATDLGLVALSFRIAEDGRTGERA